MTSTRMWIRIRSLMFLGWVPLLALVRKQRIAGVFSSLLVLPILSALVLGGLYQTLGGEGFDVERFGSHWPYFIATTAFVAGAASWEQELLADLLKTFAGRPARALLSRGTYVLVSAAPMLAMFVTVRAVTRPQTWQRDAFLMIAAIVSLSVLGSGVALRFGFDNDKGINNLVQVAPWVFAIGVSPFFPHGVAGVSVVFPDGATAYGVLVELVRYAVYAGVGVVLAHGAVGPRRRPVFSP